MSLQRSSIIGKLASEIKTSTDLPEIKKTFGLFLEIVAKMK